MDLGIIKCPKLNYRKKLVSYLISQLEIGKINAIKQLDLSVEMGFIKSSLNEIKVNSIRNCFIKAWFNVNITTQISTGDIKDV